MNCPYCGANSRVVDSRPVPDSIRRRRECDSCRRRFTTYEKVVPAEIKVFKSRGRPTEEFNSKKISRVIERLCKGRATAKADPKMIARAIEARLVDSGQPGISSAEIATMLLAELKEVDRIAFERLAVNYLDSEGRIDTSLGKDKRRAPSEPQDQYSLFDADR